MTKKLTKRIPCAKKNQDQKDPKILNNKEASGYQIKNIEVYSEAFLNKNYCM